MSVGLFSSSLFDLLMMIISRDDGSSRGKAVPRGGQDEIGCRKVRKLSPPLDAIRAPGISCPGSSQLKRARVAVE